MIEKCCLTIFDAAENQKGNTTNVNIPEINNNEIKSQQTQCLFNRMKKISWLQGLQGYLSIKP